MPLPLRGAAVGGAVLLLAAATAMLRISAQRIAPPPVDAVIDVPALPGEVARPLAFGFRSLLSDFTFLEAIQILPQRKSGFTAEQSVGLDRRLQRLLEYSVELDPKFAGAYRFAGTALPHETVDGHAMGVLAAAQLLEKGLRERPDDWHMGFLLGFLQSYYLRDYAGGSRSLAAAARQPGAPRYIGLLATRLAAEGGELKMATLLAEAMLAQANEDETRREWRNRVDALHMERDLREIEAAVARYRMATGTVPPSVRALVRSGELKKEPVEPHGGKYLIRPDGTVRSTGAERLRVFGGSATLKVR
ncbi:MAG: hypothetical protein ABR567_13685 [Myxococcales bacterium]